MIKRLSFLFFSLFFVSQIFGFEKNLINENQAGINFSIANDSEPEVHTEPMSDSFFVIQIPGAKYDIIDNILVPYWSFKIALPTMETPQISISNITMQNFSITNNEIRTDSLGSDLYKLSSPGLAGRTPTITLKIFPIQKDNDNLKYITSATISIKYASKYDKQISTSGKKDNSYLNKYSSKYFLNKRSTLSKTSAPSYPSGTWIKVTISDKNVITGFKNQSATQNIFKITYDELNDAGISESSINKDRIFLYSNETFGDEIDGFSTTPLIENARGFGDNDDTFESGDYIYFFGRSPSGLRMSSAGELYFNRNPYSFDNFYWILIADSEGSPTEVTEFESSTESAQHTATTTDFLFRKEQEKGATNILQSGNDWYGKLMDGVGTSVSESFSLPASDNDYSADITVRLKSGTEEATQYYNIYLNNTKIDSRTTSDYGVASGSYEEDLSPYSNTISIKFTSGSGKGYLDYIQCEYDVAVSTDLGNCLFFAPRAYGIVEYQIDNSDYENIEIYDVTDPSAIKKLELSSNSSTITFRDFNPGEDRKTYLMTSEPDYSTIEEIELIDSPDFTSLFEDKSAEYIIITDESMLSAAEYIAEIHNSKVDESDRLTTFVTTQADILRNFNGDLQDPDAIRSFLHYAYENWITTPKYVLLLGDGTYDHRGMDSESDNFIMTYQQKFSRWGYNYYATDFHYTYLTENDKYPDIAIGRVPASDLAEANNYAAKLEDYLVNKNYGSWRHTVSLVADDPVDPDPNDTYFTEDSEILANSVLPDIFTFNKLYLLEYPDSQDDSKYGRSKPAATAAILEALEAGTTIINYLGHGAPTIWSQENAFTSEQLPEIENSGLLPFWIAGTCTWGKFDEIYDDCMPEDLVTMNADGGIAAFGASRPTSHSPNMTFLTTLFNYWFPNDTINEYRIGDVIKNNLIGTDNNDEKYILFGDPALKLALPYTKGNFASLENDTLKALANVKVSGTTDNQSFAGNAIVTLFDSKQYVTRYYTDGNKTERSYSYKLPGDLLFKGNVNLENGQFQSSFYIPKDLNYSDDNGKIHIYGWNEESQEEFGGTYDKIIFSGSENVTDSIGPTIEFMKNDEALYDGGIISSSDQLQLKITDTHGINLTGKMGHGISVTIDDNDTEDFTSDFSYLEDNDTSGVLTLSLEELEFGNHDVTIKAWDNANNSTERNYNFTYNESEDFKISKIVNYPNPFSETTDITFYSSELCEFSIAIYSVNGLKIKEFDSQQSSGDGFTSVYWNGKDDFGDEVARGIYFYKIKAKSLETNQKDNYIGKMVKG